MVEFVARRVLQMAITVLLAVVVVFFLLYLSGDPVMLFLPMDTSNEELESFREMLGFNDPIYVQFGRFMARAVRGDFGTSLTYDESAFAIVASRIPATLMLMGTALSGAVLLAIPVGVLAALRRGKFFDQIARLITVAGLAMPNFWLGLMLILVFSVRLHILPTGGYQGARYVILPALTLGVALFSRFVRLARSSMLDVLPADYIRTARAKGVGEASVLFKHALRNASSPVISYIGLEVGRILGGAVIAETVFYWPGVGRLVVESLLRRDFAIVRVGVLLMAIGYTLSSLLVDIVYVLLNPQITYE